ncbi:MAG: imidazoleglycerol-phosphate dehydratase HisB [Syntrophomonadaceae bacterium]|nr:imidazoleglycerol-phosphate dehydratase HisB [Syntrophomonadaceae bacterium]
MGEVSRITGETQVKVQLKILGTGKFQGVTGVPFFDHMLNLWTRHGLFDLAVTAQGDLEVDAHHTVEDIGITLGQALDQALGERRAINRYGTALIPMDEALMQVAVDISGRPFLAYCVELPAHRVGDFDTELVEEFLRALSLHAGLTLHVRMLSGKNTHHIIEALFKALGRALREACQLDPRTEGIPSTKGTLV